MDLYLSPPHPFSRAVFQLPALSRPPPLSLFYRSRFLSVPPRSISNQVVDSFVIFRFPLFVEKSQEQFLNIFMGFHYLNQQKEKIQIHLLPLNVRLPTPLFELVLGVQPPMARTCWFNQHSFDSGFGIVDMNSFRLIELLDRHAYIRGYMNRHGQPDNPRSARVVLNDFVSVSPFPLPNDELSAV